MSTAYDNNKENEYSMKNRYTIISVDCCGLLCVSRKKSVVDSV